MYVAIYLQLNMVHRTQNCVSRMTSEWNVLGHESSVGEAVMSGRRRQLKENLRMVENVDKH